MLLDRITFCFEHINLHRIKLELNIGLFRIARLMLSIRNLNSFNIVHNHNLLIKKFVELSVTYLLKSQLTLNQLTAT